MNLTVKSNVDEDTYAPMDLFDDLECFSKMLNDNYSKTEICSLLNWDKNKPTILNKILNLSVNVLKLMKKHQKGRTEKKSVQTEFNMTWLNDSGIFDLCEKYQQDLMESFIGDKFNWSKAKVQSESAKYKLWQEMSELAEIDENLIRNELHYIDRGRHTTRRDEVLQELGLRRSVGRYQTSNSAESAPLKTTADIAREIGISKRTMQEEKQIIKNVLPEVQEIIKEKELPQKSNTTRKIKRNKNVLAVRKKLNILLVNVA